MYTKGSKIKVILKDLTEESKGKSSELSSSVFNSSVSEVSEE